MLLIVVNMNLSPSFLQHNTNIVMATTKQTRGKERRVGTAPTFLIVTNLHILPLFLQQHEFAGDGKTDG